MLGQTIETRSPISGAAVLNFLIVACLVALAILWSSPHPLIAAVLPLGFALGITLGRPKRIEFMVDHDGIRPIGSNQLIGYSTIHAITVAGRNYGLSPLDVVNVPMEIHHDLGTLVIPQRMNVDTAVLHNFLQSQLPPRPESSVPTILADYLDQQVAKFGPDKVTVIRAREDYTERWRLKARRWLATGILFTGITWFVVGIAVLTTNKRADDYGAWAGFGFIVGFLGLIWYLAPRAFRSAPPMRLLAKYPNSCLIIAPPGIALVQGDTKGSLPWSEITQVKSRFSQWLRASRIAGVQLQVRGAEIIIFDIYDRTPAEIEELFRRNLDLTVV